MSYTLLTDALVDEIATASLPERESWLFLESHDTYLGHWLVSGFGSYFRFDLHEIIGPHKVVSPVNLGEFLDAAEDHGYQVAFLEDPEAILEPYRTLAEPPPVSLDSTLPNTINGLLPFQARGLNFLRRTPRGGVAQWSTGTGKSALQSALLKYHRDDYALCWSLAKGHNKINTQRTYLGLAGVESILVDGTPKRRERTYVEILERLSSGERGLVVVTNYEKFRDDFCWFEQSEDGAWLARMREEFAPFFATDLLFLWDEMPTKLKTRTTKLYRAVQTCLYADAFPNWDKRRASWLKQYMFSATPIENDPEDWFNCVRLIDPGVYGTVKDFRAQYVARYSHFDRTKPERWHNLDELQLAAAHIVHQADKERDPEIKAQFPEVLPDPRVLDWSDAHLRTYNKLIELAEQSVDEAEEGDGEPINMLALITILQMYCDLPSMVTHSAALREAWEASVEDAEQDAMLPPIEGSKVAQRLLELLDGKLPKDAEHTKLLELKSIVTDEYADEKIVVFSRFNRTFIPAVSEWLERWDVPFVVYGGSLRQMQAAQDRFKSDPGIRVFLSSDRGSDSINLEEARVLTNYDSPLKYSTKVQRNNRNNRITSVFDKTVVIDLIMAGSVEQRVLEIVEKKKGYHDAVFGGVIAAQSISAGLTSADLRYILSG